MFTSTAEFPATAGVSRRPFDAPSLRGVITLLIAAAILFVLRGSEMLSDRVTQALRENAITDFGRRTSHGGLYRGDVVDAALRVGESQQWIIHLEQRNHRRVAHAAVQARVWMPETGVESTVNSAATYVGGGNYRLNDVRFTRSGWWNIALVVDAGAGVDSLAFNVRLP